MDIEANKALVRRFYEEVWARGNVAVAEEVFADDYVRHDHRPTNAPPGAAGQALIAEQFRHAFPDLEWRVDLVLGDSDLVAARWTASGTHSGPWADVAPTGKRATFSGVNIFRFGDEGKVVEIWNHRDDLGLREQLGVPVFAGAQPPGGTALGPDPGPSERGRRSMGAESASGDLDRAVELHHRAGDAIMKGDREGYAELYSRQDDVTLGNPFGPFARGYEDVLRTLQGAASHYRDGEATGFERVSEHVTPELACFVEVERYRVKVGGREEITPVSARVTSVFRKEDGVWRLVHRHADPITSPRAAESVIQQ